MIDALDGYKLSNEFRNGRYIGAWKAEAPSWMLETGAKGKGKGKRGSKNKEKAGGKNLGGNRAGRKRGGASRNRRLTGAAERNGKKAKGGGEFPKGGHENYDCGDELDSFREASEKNTHSPSSPRGSCQAKESKDEEDEQEPTSSAEDNFRRSRSYGKTSQSTKEEAKAAKQGGDSDKRGLRNKGRFGQRAKPSKRVREQNKRQQSMGVENMRNRIRILRQVALEQMHHEHMVASSFQLPPATRGRRPSRV